jgi:hypothetical protein
MVAAEMSKVTGFMIPGLMPWHWDANSHRCDLHYEICNLQFPAPRGCAMTTYPTPARLIQELKLPGIGEKTAVVLPSC